jgi:hypothetical protein
MIERAARQLDWTDDGRADDPWKVWARIAERIKTIVPRGGFPTAVADRRGNLDEAAFSALCGWQGMDRAWEEMEVVAQNITHAAIWAALQLDSEFVPFVNAFVHHHGKRFGFYPFLPDPEQSARARRAVDEYCGSIAERLLFNSELVLNAPPKYIAAAASLPECRSPLYPAGRVLLSLRYTDGGRKDLVENFLDPHLERGWDPEWEWRKEEWGEK